MATNHQPGEVIEYNGVQAIVQRDGGIRDAVTGKILKGNPPEATRITTTERAQELNAIRWHKPRQDAILQAVRDATGDEAGLLYKEHSDADGYLTREIITKIVLDDSGATRGADRVKAWEAVLEHSGTSGKAPKAAQQQVQGATLSMDRDTAVAVAQAVAAEMSKRGIVDG